MKEITSHGKEITGRIANNQGRHPQREVENDFVLITIASITFQSNTLYK
jgi:hypothetical protein